MAEQLILPLEEEITIHCFFRCGKIIRDIDPDKAHASMEQHYNERHRLQLDRILYRLGAPVRTDRF